MSRKLLEKVKNSGGENERKDYKPPDETLFDSELINRLVKHYITKRDQGTLNLWQKDDFESEFQTLESVIENAENKFHPQLLINSLTVMLRDESERIQFTRIKYLTAVVQALFNLNYGSEFAIDIKGWPDSEYYVGWYLKGREDKSLVLNLYGDVYSCGYGAEHCNFTLHDMAEWCGAWAEYCDFTTHKNVKWCGFGAKNCNFTILDKVQECGSHAKHCTFNLMPDAKIERYLGNNKNDRLYLSQTRSNKLRKMNENGEMIRIR